VGRVGNQDERTNGVSRDGGDEDPTQAMGLGARTSNSGMTTIADVMACDLSFFPPIMLLVEVRPTAFYLVSAIIRP